jgi:hypothetical protein
MSRKKRKTRVQKIGRRIPPPPKEKTAPERSSHPSPPRPAGKPSSFSWKNLGHLLSPRSSIRSDLPLYGCWITRNWEQAGMANICMARRMENGNLVFGAYLVDVWGLGLKDCFGNINIPEKEFLNQVLLKMGGEWGFVKAEESLARTLIWGGYAWAREHHFRVPPEFKTWQKLVGELQEGEKREDVVFGKDGQPFLIISLEDLENILE